MIPDLGIIEGYFGRSWTWAERAAVVSRLAPAGYRYFHYAPKIDDKLRRDWRSLHDSAAADAIQRFGEHCRANGMRFGIGLTPYDTHRRFDAETRHAFKTKLAHLDSLGIDDLVILFDDMRGDLPDLAQRQADIVAFARDHSQASRLFMCPSYYSDDPLLDHVFGPRPADYLAELGRVIDPAVAIYWTGEEVCSREYSLGHLRQMAELLGRKVALWDNYPVNDGPRMANHLHLRAFTGRPAAAGRHVSSHAINPSSQPILGCIAALTLPRSYTEGDDYSYRQAFLDAAATICGPALAALLQQDLPSLQDMGLDRLGERRGVLRARYAVIDHPAAREITAWLDGGFAITGEAVQTQ